MQLKVLSHNLVDAVLHHCKILMFIPDFSSLSQYFDLIWAKKFSRKPSHLNMLSVWNTKLMSLVQQVMLCKNYCQVKNMLHEFWYVFIFNSQSLTNRSDPNRDRDPMTYSIEGAIVYCIISYCAVLMISYCTLFSAVHHYSISLHHDVVWHDIHCYGIVSHLIL